MKILSVFVLTLVLLTCCYLFSICPNVCKDRKQDMKAFENVLIAHRGYFDNTQGVPENSLPAFKSAVEAGYGIELDVQLSKDGFLIVFHDEDLKRMCGVERNLRDMTYEEIQACRLLNTEEEIPLFSDVLKIIDGKVPLIVEVKYEGDLIATTEKMANMMDDYTGVWCMESFDPRAVKWFKKNRPNIIRGQLSTDYHKDKMRLVGLNSFLLTNVMYNHLGRPDFIAYNHKYWDNISLSICRKLFAPEMVAWTIKTPEELEVARQHHFGVIIFDSFQP